jgi:hypothetical protein
MASDVGPDTGKPEKKEQPPAPNIARTAKETNPIREPDIELPLVKLPLSGSSKKRSKLGKRSYFSGGEVHYSGNCYKFHTGCPGAVMLVD